jgi:hypothetical protein
MNSCGRAPVARSGADHLDGAAPVRVQEQHLERVAEVVMVHLVGANAIQANPRLGGNHEVEY